MKTRPPGQFTCQCPETASRFPIALNHLYTTTHTGVKGQTAISDLEGNNNVTKTWIFNRFSLCVCNNNNGEYVERFQRPKSLCKLIKEKHATRKFSYTNE